MRNRFEEEVRDVFTAGGPLARALAGFEPRPGQLRLGPARGGRSPPRGAPGGGGGRSAAEPLFEFPGEAGHYERMRRFAETTRIGDISECPGIPDDFHAWLEVNARSEMCDPSSCPQTERCFLGEVRRRAQSADLVVVHHHLYFADLSIRRKRGGARG